MEVVEVGGLDGERPALAPQSTAIEVEDLLLAPGVDLDPTHQQLLHVTALLASRHTNLDSTMSGKVNLIVTFPADRLSRWPGLWAAVTVTSTPCQ